MQVNGSFTLSLKKPNLPNSLLKVPFIPTLSFQSFYVHS
jgi:hypothetical protein